MSCIAKRTRQQTSRRTAKGNNDNTASNVPQATNRSRRANRPGNISNKGRKPTRKAKKIMGGASAGQQIANQSPSCSVPYVEKIETPPNCKWSIPWNYDIRSMKYDRKLGKFWLRSGYEESGPLLKINPWVEDNPREGHGIELVPTGPDGPLVTHDFGSGLDIDTKRGYLILTKQGNLQLIDPDTMTEILDISLGPDIFLLSLVYDDVRDLYIAADNRYKFFAINPDNHKVSFHTNLQEQIFCCLPRILQHSNRKTFMMNSMKGCLYHIDEELLIANSYQPIKIPRRYITHGFGVEPNTDGSIGELNVPGGFCVDTQGWVYVCDTNNHRIVRCIPEVDGTDTWEVILDEAQLGAKQPYMVGITHNGFMLIGFLKPPMLGFYPYPEHRL